MNGPALRALALWIARARRFLPVPLSPSRRTVSSVAATRRASATMRRIAADSAMMRPKPSRASSRRARASARAAIERRSTMWPMRIRNSSIANGLTR